MAFVVYIPKMAINPKINGFCKKGKAGSLG